MLPPRQRHMRLRGTPWLLGFMLPLAGGGRQLLAQRAGTADPQWIGSIGQGYSRLLQLTGAAPLESRMLRPLTRTQGSEACHAARESWSNPWQEGLAASCDTLLHHRVVVYAPSTRTTYNSSIPYGVNDGALWAGRGFSGSLDFGAGLETGRLTIRLVPTVTGSQNLSFQLGPLVRAPADASPYADPLISRSIDRPQRFGDKPLARVDPGQSLIRLDMYGTAVGAGTESMWWGPGVDNALLMTNNASGFPHAFIGTSRPVDIYLGKLEAMYLLGRLYDSGYWRVGTQPDRNRRWLGAALFVVEPRATPGLYVGAGRLFYGYVPAGGLSAGDLLAVLQPFLKKDLATTSNPSGNDRRDQMLSLFARWVFPEVGFEVYGEWGRNDHSWSSRDFMLEPDHASASLLGFQKILKRENGFVLIRAEATSLANGRTSEVRPEPTWYAHTIITQGFTQDGQVIGAGIGPGSDMQAVAVERYFSGGSFGVIAERSRDNSDAFYLQYVDTTTTKTLGNSHRHDVTSAVGIRAAVLLRQVRVALTLQRRVELDRYTVLDNDVRDLHATLSTEWRW